MDGQGTTKIETNAARAVTSTQETEAFGQFIGGTGSTASPFGYHGSEGYRQDGDGPAGLEPYQKVGARYYDATFGRFITRDTDLSQSPYAYCMGDPVNFSDPSGHSWAAGLGFAGAVLGVVLAAGFIVLLSPEIGGLACVGAALEFSPATTYFVGGLTPIATGYIGTLIGEDQDHQHESDPQDRPEKTGGPCVGGGDTSITNAEEEGLEAEQTASGTQATPTTQHTATFKIIFQNGVPIGMQQIN